MRIKDAVQPFCRPEDFECAIDGHLTFNSKLSAIRPETTRSSLRGGVSHLQAIGILAICMELTMT
jgi:hypothetical protein